MKHEIPPSPGLDADTPQEDTPHSERIFRDFPLRPIPILEDATARDVLAQLLPLYREDRVRWPLWTYRRRAGEGVPNWSEPWSEGVPSAIWRDRIRWSSLWPLTALLKRLQAAAGVPIDYAPGRDAHLSSEGTQRFRVPRYVQTLEAAILAVYRDGEGVGTPSEITVPGPWSLALPLDLEDYGEILHRFAKTLIEDQMFVRLLWGPSKSKKSVQAVGLVLLDRLGLAVDQSRTRKITLPAAYVRRLADEVRSIVAEVRVWKPSSELTDGVKTLVGHADLEPLHSELLARDRPLRRRGGVSASYRAAVQLRFPFLTWDETEFLLHNRAKTAEQVGDSLLRDRLAADISLGRLRDIIYSE